MNTILNSLSPDAQKVASGSLIVGGAAATTVSLLAAKSIIAIGLAANVLPIIGTIMGIVMMIFGALTFYHAYQRNSINNSLAEKSPEAITLRAPTYEEEVPEIELATTRPLLEKEEPIGVVSEEVPEDSVFEIANTDPLALTKSDKLLTNSNIVQWGLIGLGFSGVAPSIIMPLGVLASLGSEVATFCSLPKDASWLRKAMSIPLLSKVILNYNPWVARLFQAFSLYNLASYSATKLGAAWEGFKTDPVRAVKAGAVHLFNLASGVTFAADSARLINLRPQPSAKSDSPCQPNSREKCVREITVGSAYSNNSDSLRNEYAKPVDASHKEYAEKWGLKHVVNQDTDLLKGQCRDPRGFMGFFGLKHEDCSPYWHKIPVLKQWLEEPKNPNVQEEWLILLDDDMPVTNTTINPNDLINSLRGKESDASIILVEDPHKWAEWYFRKPVDPRISINGGLWIIRKDDRALDMISRIWETRNIVHDLTNSYCPTLGLCMNQDALHEQQGCAVVLQDEPRLMDHVVAIVPARDEHSKVRGHIALNTFHGHDNECYVRVREGFSSKPYVHRLTSYNPNAAWKKGDFAGQAAALPVLGKHIPVHENNNYHCEDSPTIKPTHVRYNKIKEMVDQTVRSPAPAA